MWFLFWGSVAAIFYLYIGYPIFLYIASRVRVRRRIADSAAPWPSACLVVSAFNEDKVIRDKIENSLSLDYPGKFRILVASDGSDDATVDIVNEYRSRGVVLRHNPARHGKSAVLNDVVPRLDEDIVVFTDANSLFGRDAIKNLCRHFSDPNIGCVVGRLRYVERGVAPAGRGEGAYWRYEGMLSRLESRLGSVLVANGSIFAIRRQFFSELYPEVANDFQIPIDVGAGGHEVIYDAAAEAYEPSTAYWSEEFERKVRIVLRGLSGYSRLAGRIRGLRRWQFWSHKLLRWLAGAFLITALLSNAALAARHPFYALVFVTQLLFYSAAAVGWTRRLEGENKRIFNIPFYFTMVNTAAFVAVVKFLAGKRLSVWEKAESTRLSSAPEPPSPVEHPVERESELGRTGSSEVVVKN